VRVELDDFIVSLGSHRLASSTTIAAAGPYVVVAATTLPDEVVELVSCYLAALQGPAAVSQLLLVAGPQRRFNQTLLPDALAGTTHPRRCLLHHAGALQDALGELSAGEVRVDVGPHGLMGADTIWNLDTPH
jgi:hypothetical protein